jgi:hypothetical protein
VSSAAAPATSAVARGSISTTFEIDVGEYWDAVALLEHLIPFHSFLVQHTTEHWVAHARTPGCQGESLGDALGVIEEWQATRQGQAKRSDNASVRVAGQSTGAGDGHRSRRWPQTQRRSRWNA